MSKWSALDAFRKADALSRYRFYEIEEATRMSKRQDPFRTLDDPEPRPAAAPSPDCLKVSDQVKWPADAVRAEPFTALGMSQADKIDGGEIVPNSFITADKIRLGISQGAGFWVLPASRPAWWRRALVRLVLGWKWRKYDAV